MAKLDPVKIRYAMRRMEAGDDPEKVGGEVGVTGRRVRQLHAEYRRTGRDPVLGKPGRPGRAATDAERRQVARYFERYRCSATRLERIMDVDGATHIPHNAIHGVLAGMGAAERDSRAKRQASYVRYERTWSNSMWHTDYKLLKDGRWPIPYMDDASRFITGYGVFGRATGANAIAVLHDAIRRNGRPASILSDRGAQFYANEVESRRRGASEFEKELVRLGIRHLLCRTNHPQTNGKLERFHGEIVRKMKWFRDIDELMDWWNNIKPHMSLGEDGLETPARAFKRKMPEKGTVAVDAETGEEYGVF
ncbi:MAG: DDE-type integrase/transposase/recombinase [Nitrosopumilus sp.]|nr:DDE-type integrase/transposase/recombinase [Nitrosopumilus sp.]